MEALLPPLAYAPDLVWGPSPLAEDRILKLFKMAGITGDPEIIGNSANLLLTLARKAHLTPLAINATEEGVGISMRFASQADYKAMQIFIDTYSDHQDLSVADGYSRSYGDTTQTIEVRFQALKTKNIKWIIQSYFPIKGIELHNLALEIITLIDHLAQTHLDYQMTLSCKSPLALEIETDQLDLPYLQLQIEVAKLPFRIAYERTAQGVVVYFCNPYDPDIAAIPDVI